MWPRAQVPSTPKLVATKSSRRIMRARFFYCGFPRKHRTHTHTGPRKKRVVKKSVVSISRSAFPTYSTRGTVNLSRISDTYDSTRGRGKPQILRGENQFESLLTLVLSCQALEAPARPIQGSFNYLVVQEDASRMSSEELQANFSSHPRRNQHENIYGTRIGHKMY